MRKNTFFKLAGFLIFFQIIQMCSKYFYKPPGCVYVSAPFWKCNFPMNHNVCLSVCLSKKICPNF